jgi:hypothetical protein
MFTFFFVADHRRQTPAGRDIVAAWAQKQQSPTDGAGLRCSIGAGEKSRTPDLRITNALLYQLSYTGALKRRIIEASIRRS